MTASSVKQRERKSASKKWNKHFTKSNGRKPTRKEGVLFGTGFNAGFTIARKLGVIKLNKVHQQKHDANIGDSE